MPMALQCCIYVGLYYLTSHNFIYLFICVYPAFPMPELATIQLLRLTIVQEAHNPALTA